jgi:hypothetical protein
VVLRSNKIYILYLDRLILKRTEEVGGIDLVDIYFGNANIPPD